MNLNYNKYFIAILTLFFVVSLQAQEIPLAGQWNFAIDRNDTGIEEAWYKREIKEDIIHLPGSMVQNNKGDEISLETRWTGTIYDSSYFYRPKLAPYRKPGNIKIPFWLSPIKYYAGAAWYQRKITIPKGWDNKSVTLCLERCHTQSSVWLGDILLGKSNSLVAAHQYVLPMGVKPGEYLLTIRIDNRITDMNVGPDSHSVSDHTQGNWNGIIGKIALRAKPKANIANVQVYTDVSNRKARVEIRIANSEKKTLKGQLILQAESYNSQIKHILPVVKIAFNAMAADTTLVMAELNLGAEMQLWDEFNPTLYRLTVIQEAKSAMDDKAVTFGMRSVKTEGRFITINENKVHLRGDLNNCEFPLTGYPPMDVEGWKRVYTVAKSHGFNHFRFHSWCPPEAAFIAADEVGFYLQPEGPTWPNHGTSLGDGKFIDTYLYQETARIMQDYGNHASFCLFASGNEPAGSHQATYLEAYNAYWKKQDSRHLYTGASVAMSWPLYPGSDYMIKSGPRGLDWSLKRPETMTDYREKITSFTIPYITHEMGQWCVFPDFKEIKEYTGVMRAKNFELFRDDLKAHGMDDQAEDFLMASGKLQVLCYKQEIEKSLRTPNSAGFQLLGLQDFPGQGTALIGVLNPFWKEKGYTTAAGWKRFCNSTVVLSRIPKFTYTNKETFIAGIECYHFGKEDLVNPAFNWFVRNEVGTVVEKGVLKIAQLLKGEVTPLGQITVPLAAISKAGKFTLEVTLNNTEITNSWDFWVYPEKLTEVKNKIYFTNTLDAKAEQVLQSGGTVFLNAAGKIVKGKEVSQSFTPVFWNTSWFKMKPPHTLGILVDTQSPAFNDFPTAYHSDLQWWEIVNNAQVMHLEDFPAGFRPLVQPIDTWFMNRKLGLVIEARAGNGKIVVCSADLLSDDDNRIVARQLLYSLKRYMASENFKPAAQVNIATIKALFTQPSKETWDSFTKDNPDELKPKKGNKE